MKHLLPLLLLFCFTVAAQTTPVPDPNFEQFLVDTGIDTNGLDGSILDADAATVTVLNVTPNNITDLTGLEAFVNLTSLELGASLVPNVSLLGLTQLVNFTTNNNHLLQSVDFSQNTLLQNVTVVTSHLSTSLPALDLSQNMNLVSFTVRGYATLADIDFPVTSTLNNISLDYQADPTLDFSQLDGLVDLYIRGSNAVNTLISLPTQSIGLKNLTINSIGINGTIDLTAFINLEELNLRSALVEALILPSTNTVKRITISHHNFQNTLSLASVPAVEEVNVTRSTNTIPLSIDLSNNPLLEQLTLSENNMTTVDLTNLTALKNLNIRMNRLTALDVSQNLNLDALRVNDNLLPTLDVTQNVLLGRLYIDYNMFSGTGLDLTNNPNLVLLSASNNQIASLDISQNVNLNVLNLNSNLFSGTDIMDQFYTLLLNDGGPYFGNSIDVSFNQLSGSIPDFTSLLDGDASDGTSSNGVSFIFNNNNFEFGHFEDEHATYVLMDNAPVPPPSSRRVIQDYFYAPQAKVNAIENLNRNAGENITLTTTVAGTQNHYKWFKDGVEISGAPDAPDYIITDINACDAGIYHTEITSDLVPFENTNLPGTGGKNLLLIRNEITLNVNVTKECVALNMPLTNVAVNAPITWNDNPGACGYKISIRNVDNGVILLPDEDIGELNSYTYTNDFPANTQIGVTITPYFEDGDFACSEQTFNTNSSSVTAPICTYLIAPGPMDGDTDLAVNLNEISWNPVANATQYRITIDGSTSDVNDVTDLLVNGTSHPFANVFENDEIVTVTIVPLNGSVAPMTTCTSETFTIVGATQPPGCTTLNSPVNNATNVAVDIAMISWNAANGATGYRIALTSTSGNNDLPLTDVGNNLSHPISLPFANNDIVTVTVIPYNADGDAVGPCTTESFAIVGSTPQPPTCTSLNSPTDNATNVAVDINEISWNMVSGATGYQLAITSTSGNNNLPLTDIGNNLSYAIAAPFINNDIATVTVIPYNAVGDATGCSSESFTIVSATAQPPECTSLNSPSDNTTNVAVDIHEISWNSVADATGYRLTITSTSGNNDLPLTDVGNNLSHPIAIPFANDDGVMVTVIPYNGDGDAVGPCAPQSFTIVSATPVNTLPDCTNLITPENENVAVSIDTVIEWESVSNANGYRLTIGTQSGDSDVLNEDVGILTSYTLTDTLEPGTTYFVNVVPYNAVGNATGCLEQSFTILDESMSQEEEEEEEEKEDKVASLYGFSPDGDGINEFWEIKGIENYPNNTVTIYNRWGDVVFEIEDYDNASHVFTGEANRMTQLGANELPAGTYFFQIDVPENNILERTKGFVILKR